ncbi:hypothetical protein A1QO_02580 [Vibrio genomosp. F10 str. ZF-129]|uniref:Uncharacterized protein n=1 Tax=Vibrio genomosp. F10 str. ZF-129 TaxID=1187848 RepID=A0A1E5BK86_9VIBR|nr:hypothetical protein [Vibrio genomosp. F10]OEE38283.1 hypothetical protein A1QO_02580 [Vibrio genomosp. F10 str. ZF-129]
MNFSSTLLYVSMITTVTSILIARTHQNITENVYKWYDYIAAIMTGTLTLTTLWPLFGQTQYQYQWFVAMLSTCILIKTLIALLLDVKHRSKSSVLFIVFCIVLQWLGL